MCVDFLLVFKTNSNLHTKKEEGLLCMRCVDVAKSSKVKPKMASCCDVIQPLFVLIFTLRQVLTQTSDVCRRRQRSRTRRWTTTTTDNDDVDEEANNQVRRSRETGR